ncbi:glycoside hydrolase family 19 protein, partial [Streptomyces sp. NPDC002589]|uniref:glycoside hydrolase family 19 protein n=1 Tax=Streptomyces sp. NPDC002589 TaxID=3154420 RepID=UPI0033252E6A
MAKSRSTAVFTAAIGLSVCLLAGYPAHAATGGAIGRQSAPAHAGQAIQADFVVSEGQFDQMFPNRNSFYTYSGLTAALSAYPGFANTGSDTVRKQEAAAFLA